MDETLELLVADDDAIDRAIIGEFLRASPYQVCFASDGLQAWQLLDDAPERFAVLVLDRLMPGLNGMDVLARLRQDRRFLALPVIMQTAADTPDEVAEGLLAGAWYYLAKPYTGEALCQLIRSALHDRQQRLEVTRLRAELGDTWSLLRSGSFSFRTPDQARLLAARLGGYCPDNPQVAVGLAELMLNAVEHGNLGLGYALKGELLRAGQLAVEIERRLAEPGQGERWAQVAFMRKADRIIFRIRDCGAGFEWQRFLEFDPARLFDLHGRGIAMARELAFDQLSYRGNGNAVTATVRTADAPISR